MEQSIDQSIDQLVVNTIKTLAMDAVQKAKSGHPGAPMGLADVATVLWTRHLTVDPSNPDFIDRDRFVLSGGHGSMPFGMAWHGPMPCHAQFFAQKLAWHGMEPCHAHPC